jgi:hypothetical protein
MSISIETSARIARLQRHLGDLFAFPDAEQIEALSEAIESYQAYWGENHSRGKHLALNVYWREDRNLVEIADRAVKLYSALADFTEHPSATHWVALSKAMDYYQEYWFNEFEGERANES